MTLATVCDTAIDRQGLQPTSALSNVLTLPKPLSWAIGTIRCWVMDTSSGTRLGAAFEESLFSMGISTCRIASYVGSHEVGGLLAIPPGAFPSPS